MFGSKKHNSFFTALCGIAENVTLAMHYINGFQVSSPKDFIELHAKLKNYLIEGDLLIQKLFSMLSKSFITPIERDDILHIAKDMNHILVEVESLSAYLELYAFNELNDSIRLCLKYTEKSSEEITKAMDLLANKKIFKMHVHTQLIKNNSRVCNDILRHADHQLFQIEKNSLRIMQYRDIYKQLKDISDCSLRAADRLETIMMRNT